MAQPHNSDQPDTAGHAGSPDAEREPTPITDSEPRPLPAPIAPQVTSLTATPRPVQASNSPIDGIVPDSQAADSAPAATAAPAAAPEVAVAPVAVPASLAAPAAPEQAPQQEIRGQSPIIGGIQEAPVITLDNPEAADAAAAVDAAESMKALAKRRGVNITTITPTGKGGKVTRADVEAAARALKEQAAAADSAEVVEAAEVPTIGSVAPVEKVPTIGSVARVEEVPTIGSVAPVEEVPTIGSVAPVEEVPDDAAATEPSPAASDVDKFMSADLGYWFTSAGHAACGCPQFAHLDALFYPGSLRMTLHRGGTCTQGLGAVTLDADLARGLGVCTADGDAQVPCEVGELRARLADSEAPPPPPGTADVEAAACAQVEALFDALRARLDPDAYRAQAQAVAALTGDPAAAVSRLRRAVTACADTPPTALAARIGGSTPLEALRAQALHDRREMLDGLRATAEPDERFLWDAAIAADAAQAAVFPEGTGSAGEMLYGCGRPTFTQRFADAASAAAIAASSSAAAVRYRADATSLGPLPTAVRQAITADDDDAIAAADAVATRLAEVAAAAAAAAELPPAAAATAPALPPASAAAVPPALAAPVAAAAPALAAAVAADLLPEQAAPAAELPPEQAALEATLAEAELARMDESARFTIELGPFLSRAEDGLDGFRAELGALMRLTLCERTEAVAAIKDGRLTRLGLRIRDLDVAARGQRQAWIRLREGSMKPWSLDPFRRDLSDEEVERLMTQEAPTPTLFQKLIYGRGIHIIAGPGGCGKTWLALAICLAAVPAIKLGEQRPYAVYLDLDQNFALTRRLVDLGTDRNGVRRQDVLAVNVREQAHQRGETTSATFKAIVEALVAEPTPPRVVVLDSLTRVIAESGENSNDSDGVTRIINSLTALAERCAVVILDHVGWHVDGRPSGAAAKVNASHAVMTLSPIETDAAEYPDTIVAAKIVQTKDRDGGWRTHRDLADRDPAPTLGMLAIDREEASGRTEVRFIPSAAVAAAQQRRASEGGVDRAAAYRVAILRAVEHAAEWSVDVTEAQRDGVEPRPPLSERGIADAVWPRFEAEQGCRRGDLRAEVKAAIKDGDIVPYLGSWGRNGGGQRYRLKGPIGGDAGPVNWRYKADRAAAAAEEPPAAE